MYMSLQRKIIPKKLINAFWVITGLIKAPTPNFVSSLKFREFDLLFWFWDLISMRFDPSTIALESYLNFTSSFAFHGQ